MKYNYVEWKYMIYNNNNTGESHKYNIECKK